ncbi:hypothetical protein ACHAXA_007566 [Cyclostephanos tholiformis]|uniref:UDP-galactopyranose mutase C-terminal domain-containing protein n=1 Tax=Cyclostephanos tholiformis TaxID=382380 RepID=A0ABD3SR23_9STRA
MHHRGRGNGGTRGGGGGPGSNPFTGRSLPAADSSPYRDHRDRSSHSTLGIFKRIFAPLVLIAAVAYVAIPMMGGEDDAVVVVAVPSSPSTREGGGTVVRRDSSGGAVQNQGGRGGGGAAADAKKTNAVQEEPIRLGGVGGFGDVGGDEQRGAGLEYDDGGDEEKVEEGEDGEYPDKAKENRAEVLDDIRVEKTTTTTTTESTGGDDIGGGIDGDEKARDYSHDEEEQDEEVAESEKRAYTDQGRKDDFAISDEEVREDKASKFLDEDLEEDAAVALVGVSEKTNDKKTLADGDEGSSEGIAKKIPDDSDDGPYDGSVGRSTKVGDDDAMATKGKIGEDIDESSDRKKIVKVIPYDSDDVEKVADGSTDVKVGEEYIKDSSDQNQTAGDNTTKHELLFYKMSADEVKDTEEKTDNSAIMSDDKMDEYKKNDLKSTVNTTDANVDDIDAAIEKKSTSTHKKNLDEVGATIDADENLADATKNIEGDEKAKKVDTINESTDAEKDAGLESGLTVNKTLAIEGMDDEYSDDEKEPVGVMASSKKGGKAMGSTGNKTVASKGVDDDDLDDEKESVDIKASSMKSGEARSSTGNKTVATEGADDEDSDNEMEAVYVKVSSNKGTVANEGADDEDSDYKKKSVDIKASSKRGRGAMSSAGNKTVANEGADGEDSDDEKEAVDVKISSKIGGKAKEDVDSAKIINSPALEKEYDNCIVGAGLSGSVIAENYASQFGQTSLIIEKRNHIAGNCYDYIDEETGIRVSLFGAHLFHTRHERVWEYVQKFSEWVPYEHKVLGMVNGKLVPIPVTIDTVNILFDMNIKTTEEMDEFMKKERVPLVDEKGKPREAVNSEEVALANVGQRLYDLIFKPYTFKQWAKYPAELGPEVLSRIPVRNNHDGRYFSDPHQALPKDGYTSFFEKMLNNSKITVLTNTDYFEVKDTLKCKRLYYTGQIDTYFADLGWPKLEYRSLDFERVVQKDTPGFYQAAVVVNHPQFEDVNGTKVDYTRIVEYKHLLNQTSNHTIYVIERSKDGGEPYYPVPNQENKDLYKKYQDMADKEKGVTFVGRLANYKYFNMDDAILNALELFDKDTKDMVKTTQTKSDDASGDKKEVDAGNLLSPKEKASAGKSGTKSDAQEISSNADVARVLDPEEIPASATEAHKSIKSDIKEKVPKDLESDGSIAGTAGKGKSVKSNAEELEKEKKGEKLLSPVEEAEAGDPGTKSDAQDPSADAKVARLLDSKEKANNDTVDIQSVVKKSDAKGKVEKKKAGGKEIKKKK